ncbi:MAG: hypothetical protein QOJ01_1924 [Solirubrobacterales bacterium]|jgi:cytochrome c biogenesis protein CcdA|nr:hypothetical protein [Solirubrobacterales bacterium]
MSRLSLLVASIALADAVNPGTVGPALYLATGSRARARITAFAAAFLAVNLAGGLVLVLGPGQLILSALPHPSRTARFTIELLIGLTLLVVGTVLLRSSRRAGPEEPRRFELGGRGAGALGATIAAVEFPTALPYFAAIAAIVGSGQSLGSQLLLVTLFNVVFITPVLVVVGALTVGGARAAGAVRRAGDWLRTRWRRVVATLALSAGLLLAAFGATALLGLR